MPVTKRSKRGTKRSVKRTRRSRRNRKSSNVSEWASLSCKRSLEDPAGQPGFNSNVLYNLMNVQLGDFERATSVASQYQHYRIKKVSVTFKPTFDSYIGAAGAVSKPNLYYMIDKAGAISTTVTLEGLKGMGARPKQLDEKNMTVSWSPSVLESAMYTPGVNNATPSKYAISPWLTTTGVPVQPGAFVPSGIDHLGLYWYVDQLSNPIGAQYTIEVECQFQFKKPLDSFAQSSTVEARPARVATRNNSPDGVVGGGDGI